MPNNESVRSPGVSYIDGLEQHIGIPIQARQVRQVTEKGKSRYYFPNMGLRENIHYNLTFQCDPVIGQHLDALLDTRVLVHFPY